MSKYGGDVRLWVLDPALCVFYPYGKMKVLGPDVTLIKLGWLHKNALLKNNERYARS